LRIFKIEALPLRSDRLSN